MPLTASQGYKIREEYSDIKEKNIGFNKADSISVSVAAASILAKVARDQMMTKIYNNLYPGYFFESNKGYGSKAHIESLNSIGVSKIHRKSFKPISNLMI